MSRIASSSTVTLRGISFTNSNAIGGNGGPQAFNIGGGGGMGGNGGAGEGVVVDSVETAALHNPAVAAESVATAD